MSQFQLLTAFTGTWGLSIPTNNLDPSASVFFAGKTAGGTYSLHGSWPASVTIDAGTGALTNDGTNAGTYRDLKYGITVNGVLTKTPPFVLILDVPDLNGVPASAAGYFGGSAPGGTYALDGSWPTGVTINANTGVISGTAASGVYPDLRVAYTVGGVTTYTNLFTVTVPVLTASRLLAFTSGGDLSYSDDFGDNWTSAGTVLPGRPFATLYHKGRWIAAIPTLLDNAIYTSDDNGLTWTQRNIAAAGFQIVGLAVNPNNDQICASGPGAFASTDYGIWTSSDNGSSWGPRIVNVFKGINSLGLIGISWVHDRFVYFPEANVGGFLAATSTNLGSWVTYARPGSSPSFPTQCFYVGGLFVLVTNNGSYAGNTYWTTADFLSFTARTGPTTPFKSYLNDQAGLAVELPGGAVAMLVSNAPSVSTWGIYKTVDGINWTLLYNSVASALTQGLCQFGDKYAARTSSSTGALLLRSIDGAGASWATVGGVPDSTLISALADQPNF